MKCIVTGGAGFIGSHLTDLLVSQGHEVVVIDSMVAGREENLSAVLDKITLIKKDLLADGWQSAFNGAERVYHIAADPDVRGSARKSWEVYENNVTATVRVLEAMKQYDVREIVFTSTSTVYGEASVIPTPETYSPMIPISIYAASKLACEAMISSYAATYNWHAWVYRFANIIGPRSTHGVIYDFVQKLRANPNELEILGDGTQSKSYLSVFECVKGMVFAPTISHDVFNFFNIGSEDWVSVKQIAELVVEEMGLKNVTFKFTGGDRGWVGDVPKMQLGVDKLKSFGWEPGTTSVDSVRMAIRATIDE